jgi:hypothetical protein
MAVRIKTDNKWRMFKYGYELPKKCRKEFDWMSDEEYSTHSFAYYRKRYYALGEFMVFTEKNAWDGYIADSYFSGIVIKLSKDGDRYKIGLYLS